MQKSNAKSKLFSIIFLIICLIVALFPIYWMLNTSLKTQSEIYSKVPTFIPQKPTIAAYSELINKTSYLNGLKNSFIIALVVSFFSIAIAYPAAYAIARINFKGRIHLARGILFTYLVPAAVLYIPLFVLVSRLNLNDNILGLIVIYPTITVPYVAWILIPYISSIPYEIEESAVVDGCNRLQSMYRIIFPLAIPGIISTFIFAFTMCWGEYLYALVNINSTHMKTFPLIIAGLIFGDIYPWGQLMAGGVLACIPILFCYMITSNFIVGGLTAGGVKE